MKLDFLKDRYDSELQRKEQLTSALTLPVGVLSGLGGLMAAMVRSFPHKTLLLTVPFGTAFGLDVVAFFFCLVYLARAYHRQKYMYLPLLSELEEWEEEFRAFYTRQGQRIATRAATSTAAGFCIGRASRSSPCSSAQPPRVFATL